MSLITGQVGTVVDRKKYIAANTIGIQIEGRDEFITDVAIFEKEKIGKLKGKYFDVPPKIVIEVDVRADVTDIENGADGYVMQKAQKLLDFGVEKVLWIITSMKRVYIIDRNDPTWHIVDWSETIPVLDDCVLNVKQLLDGEEIDY